MRNILGYLLGLLLFVLGIPALMWVISGRGFPYLPESPMQVIVAVILVLAGLALSIWSIVYMRRVGKGNPFDAYGYEVAPRTKHLMTDGPYGICRNPMLLGVYILDAGVLVYLWSFWALMVFAVEAFFLTRQVRSEEKRLVNDFGEEYEAYMATTKRYVPSIPALFRSSPWLGPRFRLFSIYLHLGYNPWRKPREVRVVKDRKGVYMGAREAIPFLNDDAKRTFTQLIFRPGYLMRDYIQHGQHERYLAPFTALLVFYSVITLFLAVVQPKSSLDSSWDKVLTAIQKSKSTVEKAEADTTISVRFMDVLLQTASDAILLSRLDLYPEQADTPWKGSLAALEANIRSKGIPMFLGTFLLMWLAMAFLLRKTEVSVSGAAAASAYVLCQFCVFMFLALLVTWGKSAEVGLLLMALLLFLDYRQWLGLSNKGAFWLTVKTGILIFVFRILFFLLLAGGLVLFTLSKV
jgi:protein-S-isoprenylcysteine O-methyltransferase Ste14